MEEDKCTNKEEDSQCLEDSKEVDSPCQVDNKEEM